LRIFRVAAFVAEILEEIFNQVLHQA